MTDFGLARLEEGEGITQSRELVGTLRYMAPERFRGTSDRRGDVYSLGATLYELLTLRPPFEGDDQVRLMEQIREESPPPPRQHDPSIPRDLETIVLKALAKDPRDRFASAGELADELRRFVEGRPIRSRPISAAERFVRWCRRDPWLARATIAAAVLAVALVAGSTWAALLLRGQVRQIKDQRDQIGRTLGELTRADRATRKNLFDALVAQARSTRFSRRQGQRFDSLAALHRAADLARQLELPTEGFDRLRDEAIACLALPDVEAVGRPVEVPAQVMTIFNRGMTRYAQRSRDGTTVVRAADDDRELARFRGAGVREFWVFTFSPDGRFLASSDSPSFALHVWDIDRGTLAVEDPGPVEQTVQFRPDGRRIFVPRQGRLHEYDLESRHLIRTWSGRASQIAAHPDGKRIAAVDNTTRPPTCRILGEGSDQPLRSFPLRVRTYFLTWSPDGRTLVTAGDDYKLDLWDAVDGIHRATLEGHINHGLYAAFHPSGALLASDGWEARLRLWDPILGRALLSLPGASQVGFSPDGRIVVDLDRRLTTYRVNAALEYRALAFASAEVPDYADPSVRHDGRLLAVGTNRGAVIWDLARGTELAFLAIGNSWHVKFDPAGDLVTSGDVGVQRWPVRIDRDARICRIGPPRALPLPATYGGVAMDRTGRIVAVANQHHAHVTTPGRNFTVGPLDDCRSVAVNPDGRWLATGSHVVSRSAQVWRIADGQKVKELPIDGGTSVSFSPDGKWLAAGYPRLKLWEVGTWEQNTRIADAGRFFSPDGRIMVVAEPDRTLRLVEVDTGHTLARLEGPDECTVKDMTFTPDGSRLIITTNEPPSARVWDLRAIRRKLAELGLDWQAPAYPGPDPADPTLPPLRPAEVDYGTLAGHIEDYLEPRETVLRRYTERLARDPRDVEAYHHRAHALAALGRYREAVADLSRAIALRPGDGHLHTFRGSIHRQVLRDHESAVADFEAALVSP
ncbi:MAG: protein kinase domain-containing protein, partial [Isosphaeraceae bacterium]